MSDNRDDNSERNYPPITPGKVDDEARFIFLLLQAPSYGEMLQKLRRQVNESPTLLPDIEGENDKQRQIREDATIMAAIRNIVLRGPGRLQNIEAQSIVSEVEIELTAMATRKTKRQYRGLEGPLSENDDDLGIV